MTTKTFELSWEPVHKGNKYCSPACGHGCTHEAYLIAQKKAKKLAKRMGKGWEPVVWENMGWHYRIVKGELDIHSESIIDFSCNLDGWFWTHARNPHTALRKTQELIKKEISRLQKGLL